MISGIWLSCSKEGVGGLPNPVGGYIVKGFVPIDNIESDEGSRVHDGVRDGIVREKSMCSLGVSAS